MAKIALNGAYNCMGIFSKNEKFIE